MSPSNRNDAYGCVNKLEVLLGRRIRFVNLDDSPQQENSSDCGIYVCIQMRHLLLNRLLSANSKEKVSMSMAGKFVDANGGRKEMLKIIEALRKEGERRRSVEEHRNSKDGRSASPFLKGPAPPRSPPRIDYEIRSPQSGGSGRPYYP